MKNYILTALLAISFLANSVYAGNTGPKNEEKATDNSSCNVNELNARIFEDKVFFNVILDFESENCIYSLVRFNKDGSITSVGIKNGFKNLTNLSLLYPFNDPSIPPTNVEYVLYRITAESEVIGKWNFNFDSKKIQSVDISESLSNITK